jgi:hypothetical protein
MRQTLVRIQFTTYSVKDFSSTVSFPADRLNDDTVRTSTLLEHKVGSNMTSGLAVCTNISGGRNISSAGLHWSDSSAIDGLLTGEDVRALFRLRRMIEPDLARRSVTLLRPLDLARLERQATLLSTYQLDFEQLVSVHESFYLGLLGPAITNSELRVIRFLSDELTGHFRTGLRLSGLHPAELGNRRLILSRLLDSFRGGVPAQAEAAMREYIEAGEVMGLLLAGKD